MYAARHANHTKRCPTLLEGGAWEVKADPGRKGTTVTVAGTEIEREREGEGEGEGERERAYTSATTEGITLLKHWVGGAWRRNGD